MTRPFARYAMTTTGVALLGGGIFTLVFRGSGDAVAVWISAAVAVVVQLVAFVLSRLAGTVGGLSARMGAGALVRLFALIIYALLVSLVFHLPLPPALISLVSLFLLSTLLEPLLIKS